MLDNTEKPKLNLFYRLIILLGILPPDPLITGYSNSIFQRYYKLYVVFLSLLITLASVVTQISHFYMFQAAFPNSTLIVTDGAVDIIGSLCNIITMLAPTFWYSSSLSAILDNCNHLCKTSFMLEVVKITSSKRFAIKIAITHLILFFLFAFDGYVYIEGFGVTEYSFFIFRKIQMYHNFATILAIYVFVKFAKSRLDDTNNFLKEKLESRGIIGRKRNLSIEVSTKFDNDHTSSYIRDVTQHYENHVQLIALFNKLFGCQLLFLTFTCFVGLLNSINLIILIYFSNYQMELRTYLILTHLFWTLWQLIIGGLAVVMCTETEEAGRETGDICLNALTNLPYSSENERLKEELSLLNRLVSQKNPTFSAAGFFSMNYSLLISIIGSVTSYVIVLIQFNKV